MGTSCCHLRVANGSSRGRKTRHHAEYEQSVSAFNDCPKKKQSIGTGPRHHRRRYFSKYLEEDRWVLRQIHTRAGVSCALPTRRPDCGASPCRACYQADNAIGRPANHSPHEEYFLGNFCEATASGALVNDLEINAVKNGTAVLEVHVEKNTRAGSWFLELRWR